jgi:hypothetical protein
VDVLDDWTYDCAVPLNLMQRGRFLDNLPLPFETVLLLPEAGFQYGICRENDVVFGNLLGVRVPATAMPNEDLQAFSVRFDLMLPLHEGDSRAASSEPQ